MSDEHPLIKSLMIQVIKLQRSYFSQNITLLAHPPQLGQTLYALKIDSLANILVIK